MTHAAAAVRVSVVVPVYNRAATIGHALHSLIEQTVPVFEIIVVDDGSTDETESVVRSIRDPRVRYVRQANGGAGSARNRALDLAEGDWVAFLDSDDWWERGRIAAALAAISSNAELDFLQSNRLHVYPDGQVDQGLKAGAETMRSAVALIGGFTIKTSAVMIRRDLIERFALRFPTDQKTCEDYHLFWRAVLFARVIGFVQAPDVRIRALPDSLSRGNSEAFLQRDNIKALIEVRKWARDHGARTEHIDALTEHLHWQFRDYFVMLLHGRHIGTLVRYVALAVRHESLWRAVRGLLSAVKGLASPSLIHER